MRAIVSGIFWFMFLVLFTYAVLQVGSSLAKASGLAAAADGSLAAEMVPVVEGEIMTVMVNESRRKLGSFQICALCTCCGGVSRSYCLSSPCCYAINCNIPNRPFGFCSFTPKTCNCFGCHL